MTEPGETYRNLKNGYGNSLAAPEEMDESYNQTNFEVLSYDRV